MSKYLKTDDSDQSGTSPALERDSDGSAETTKASQDHDTSDRQGSKIGHGAVANGSAKADGMARGGGGGGGGAHFKFQQASLTKSCWLTFDNEKCIKLWAKNAITTKRWPWERQILR